MKRRIDYEAVLRRGWARHRRRRRRDAPTVISLFAGAGGSSLGFSMAGYRELLAVEWNKEATDTLRINFPGVKVHQGDIGQLSVKACMDLAGCVPRQLDVLDGSPPCQGFSTAGDRKIDDPRNMLFQEYVRLLRGLQPRAFVMENVSGMIRGKMHAVYLQILQELRGSGYRVRARLLNAKWFGVPQSRARLIFIGVREDWAQLHGIDPSHPRGQSWPIPLRRVIGHLGDVQNRQIGHVWLDESPAGRNTRTWWKAHFTRQGKIYAGQHRRLRWNSPSDTLTTGGLCGMPYVRSVNCHPQYTRTLSVLESKLIGSFPPEFQFPGTISDAFRQIGNSVPPLFMRAIAEHVRKHILKKPLD